MNLLDKTIEIIDPVRAEKRKKARLKLKKYNILNKGYGNHGASVKKNAFQKWFASLGGVKSDIYDHKDTLVARSRDLYMGSPITRGAINTILTNVIGSGLKLKSSVDLDILGKDEKEMEKLENKIEKEFSLWANDKIEQTGILDFYGVQDLVFLTTLLNGECFILLNYYKTPKNPYELKLNVIEPDRIKTPKDKESDKSVIQGVKRDKLGRVEGYYIFEVNPNDEENNDNYKYVPIYGSQGQLNIIHLMMSERPGQVRGVPLLSPVMESLKQLDRYTNAELMSAVVSSMLTVFIESTFESQGEFGEMGDIQSGNSETPNLELGNGAILELSPGERANSINPSRPNAQFQPFMVAILQQIGTSLGVPYELLVLHFTSSYSASRAALLEAWKMFRKRREWLARNFCQVVYEEWLREAVYIKRLEITDYYSDFLIQKAYSNAIWNGPSQGQLDPWKEVKASVMRIDNGLSTRTKEVAELNGGDFEQNIRIIARENNILKEKGVKLNAEKITDNEFEEE